MKVFRLSLIMMLICGLGFPLVTVGISQLLFPVQANGSLVMNDHNQVVGSRIIGQSFQGPEFFHGRISSIEYDGVSSGSKNYAPSNEEMMERTRKLAEEYLKQNPNKTIKDIPLDLVTNSASGLDPHISPEAAKFQIPRIAKETNLSEEELNRLVAKHIEGKEFGVFGEPRVNVLLLNLDLEKLIQGESIK